MKNEFHIISESGDFQLVFDDATCSVGSINGQEFIVDSAKTATGFHLLKDGKGYVIDVVRFNKIEKTVRLRINNKYYDYQVRDRFDDLLEKLGMDIGMTKKVLEVKAPMPGLVLDIMISPGEVIKVNQPLMILEAMKMENVIKSTTESTVKNISVSKGDSVEKNQILIEFN